MRRGTEVHKQWGGKDCDGPILEEEDCEIVACPVDCEISDWEDEGVCDRQCGGGKHYNTRGII